MWWTEEERVWYDQVFNMLLAAPDRSELQACVYGIRWFALKRPEFAALLKRCEDEEPYAKQRSQAKRTSR